MESTLLIGLKLPQAVSLHPNCVNDNTYNTYSQPPYAAGVICSTATYPDNYLELRGGDTDTEGNVWAVNRDVLSTVLICIVLFCSVLYCTVLY